MLLFTSTQPNLKSPVTAFKTNGTLIHGFSSAIAAATPQGNGDLRHEWTNLPIWLPSRMSV